MWVIWRDNWYVRDWRKDWSYTFLPKETEEVWREANADQERGKSEKECVKLLRTKTHSSRSSQSEHCCYSFFCPQASCSSTQKNLTNKHLTRFLQETLLIIAVC